jgi:hypothetical protein
MIGAATDEQHYEAFEARTTALWRFREAQTAPIPAE